MPSSWLCDLGLGVVYVPQIRHNLPAMTTRPSAACLELIRRDVDYAIFSPEGVLRDEDGLELALADPRPLEHLLVQMTLGPGGIPPLKVFSAIFGKPPDQGIDRGWFSTAFLRDPVVLRKGRAAPVQPTMDSLDLSHPSVSAALNGLAALVVRLNGFLIEVTQGAGGWVDQPAEKLSEWLEPAFMRLDPERRAGMRLLSEVHEAGVLLPLLLLSGRITVSEYAIFLLGLEITGRGASTQPESISGRFRRILEEAFSLTEFLTCLIAEEKRGGVRELIAAGESYLLEFKSSLVWNIKAGRKDPAIEHAALKTLAAFLNSSGGNLLLGVRDDGSAEGIEVDGFHNQDRFALHFWNLVKSSMGQDVCHFIKGRFDELDGKSVFVVNCVPATRPVFLSQKGFDEEFYIRVGPSSARLSIQEALQYIAHRFRKS